MSNLRLPWKTEGAPGIFHCMVYTFCNQEFWATCMRLHWKTESALIFFTVLYVYFLSFRIFEQLVLALKNRVAQEFFTVWNILFTFRIWNNLRSPWKTEGALNSLYWMYFFIILEFWVTCACPENRVALEFFTVLNLLFTFRIFVQLALALKNRGCPEFTVLNVYFLSFRIFEQIALFLTNRVALEFFAVLKYILLFRIFEQLAVALKT